MELRNSFLEDNKILFQYKGQWYLMDREDLIYVVFDVMESHCSTPELEKVAQIDTSKMTDTQRIDFILNEIFMHEEHFLPRLKDYIYT